MTTRYSAFTPGNTPEEAPDKTGYRILCVDDEPNVLSALRRIFRHENYHIDTAMSGAEALQLIKENPYQCVISDYKMPHMSGVELLKRIKILHPATMRIMLTGAPDTAAVLGAIKAAINSGYKTIVEDALSKVLLGLTTCEEVLRVLGPQEL